jgi:hypothetical protein
MIYFSALKMPETFGLGSDCCFLGASEEQSKVNKIFTSSTTCEFAVDIHKVG